LHATKKDVGHKGEERDGRRRSSPDTKVSAVIRRFRGG